MDTLDFKKLTKLIKLCQKNGLTSIKIDNLELSFSEYVKPVKESKKQSKTQTDLNDTIFSGMPDNEQLLFWSSDVSNDASAPVKN